MFFLVFYKGHMSSWRLKASWIKVKGHKGQGQSSLRSRSKVTGVIYCLYMHWPTSTFACKCDVHRIFSFYFCGLYSVCFYPPGSTFIIGAFHTGSAQGSDQKILSWAWAKPSVWTGFSSDFQCRHGISDLSWRKFTLVAQLGPALESEPSSEPSQCQKHHNVWKRDISDNPLNIS